MDEKLRMMERFRIMAEKERREKSKFRSMYKILETVFPLIVPDELEPAKPAELEAGEGGGLGDFGSSIGGGGGSNITTPKGKSLSTPQHAALHGTMQSDFGMNDGDLSRPDSSGNLLTTPKGVMGKDGKEASASSAVRASRASFQNHMYGATTTPKSSTANKFKILTSKKAKKVKSFSERDSRLQRLEWLYAGYLEERYHTFRK